MIRTVLDQLTDFNALIQMATIFTSKGAMRLLETRVVSSALSVLTLVLSVCNSGTICMAQQTQWASMFTCSRTENLMLFGGKGMIKEICGTWPR